LTAAWINDAVINFEWFQWDDRYLKAAATARSNGNDEQRGLLFTKSAIFLLKENINQRSFYNFELDTVCLD
jgi:hypothetical protein